MRPVFIYLFLLLTGWGCRKEINTDNSDKSFPLKLDYSNEGESLHFSWEAANIRGFEKTILVHSSEPFTSGSGPTGTSKTTVFESTDPFATSTTVSHVFFDSVGYYKLFFTVNGRFLESNEVTIENEVMTIKGNYILSHFYPDSNWVAIVYFDPTQSQFRLAVADYGQNRIYHSTESFSQMSSDQTGICIGHTGGKPEIWLWSTIGYLQATLPGLKTIKKSNNTLSTQYSIAAGGSNVMMTTQNSISSSFNVRQKGNLSILKSYSRPNYFEHRTLLMLDTVTNLVAEISQLKMEVFRINPTTGVIEPGSNISTSTDGLGTNFLNDVPVSRDRQFFCPNVRPKIYNRNLTVEMSDFISPGDFMIDLAFSKNGKHVYPLVTSSINASKVEKISFPDGANQGTITVNRMASRIQTTDDGIVLLVSDFSSSQANIFIKKLKF